MHYTAVAHKVGANIDTDAIIPARYLVTTNVLELGAHCLSGLEQDWVERVQPGDILVAGPNFGCGSSREHAPLSILGAKISVVLAHSFARIFYRNAFNMGLPLLEIGSAADKIENGQTLEVDVRAGRVENKSSQEVYTCPAVPEFMQELLAQGGLIPYVRKRLQGSEGQRRPGV